MINVTIKVGNREYPQLYAIAERDITSEEIIRGVANYLKHQNAPGSNHLIHGILTVSLTYVIRIMNCSRAWIKIMKNTYTA